MRCCVLLAAVACVAFAAPSKSTSDKEIDSLQQSLREVFSAIGGLNTCYEPCVGDLIFAARELLFFKDTVNKFKDLCHTYENAQLCVSAKELQCMQTSSFAVDASGIEELCDETDKKYQKNLPCVQKNLDNILNECNSDCWFTPALTDLVNKDVATDASSTDESALGKDLEEVCPATACFATCIARELDNSCDDAGTELISALLRPFFIDAGLLAGSDPEMVAASTAALPDSCKAFTDASALVNMTRGTYQVDPSALKKLQSSLPVSMTDDDSSDSTTESTDSTADSTGTATEEPSIFRAAAVRPRIGVVIPNRNPIRPIGFFRPPFGRRFGGRFGFGHRFGFPFHH